MKLFKYWTAILSLGLMLSNTSLASTEQENRYLIQVLNQLDAMKPLILAAKKEQSEHQRMQFHYTAWRDSHGQLHNGLLEDIQAIKAGIAEKLHAPAIEPRPVEPIQGDYFGAVTESRVLEGRSS